METRLTGGFDGGLNDVLRGGEVRFARPETDHRTSGSLQRLGLGIDGEGGGFGDGRDAPGDAGVGRHGIPVFSSV